MRATFRFERFWDMGTYKGKPAAHMREIGCQGGFKSGETRLLNRVDRIVAEYAAEKGIPLPPDITEILPESILKRESRAGGSHDTDWRCPKCHHFNSIKSRGCSKCQTVSPTNGRLTRAALRERQAEYRNQAILARYGL